MQKRNTQTLINLVSSIVTLCFSAAISFFLSPYIVKTLGEEANGFTQLANNFITYASLLTLALNSMASRFITVNYYKKDIEACKRYYSSAVIGNLVIMLILILPATVCVYKLEQIINISNENVSQVKILFAFVFATFFVQQITSILNIATYVKNSLYIQNVVEMVNSILRAILLVLAFSLFAPKMYYVSAVGFILAIISAIVALLVKRKIFSDVPFDFKAFDIKSIIHLVSSGVWNTLNQCGHILMTGLDLLLSNLLIGPGPMGVLSVAKTIPTLVTQLATTVNTSFSPNQTIAYSADDGGAFLNSLEYAKKISCAIISIPIMVFCVFCYDFYKLWQPTLNAKDLAVLSILTLLIYIPFCATQTLYNIYTATNKLAFNSISFLITGGLSAIATLIAVKYTSLGIFAVAGISSIFSILRNLFISIPYAAKLMNKKWYYFYKDVLLSLISCLIVGTISFIIRMIFSPHSWFMLFLACFIAVIFTLVANVFILLNKSQRIEFFNKILKREKKTDGQNQ